MDDGPKRDGALGGRAALEDGGRDAPGSLDRSTDATCPFLVAVVGRAAIAGILCTTEDLVVQVLDPELGIEIDEFGSIRTEDCRRDIDKQVRFAAPRVEIDIQLHVSQIAR